MAASYADDVGLLNTHADRYVPEKSIKKDVWTPPPHWLELVKATCQDRILFKEKASESNHPDITVCTSPTTYHTKMVLRRAQPSSSCICSMKPRVYRTPLDLPSNHPLPNFIFPPTPSCYTVQFISFDESIVVILSKFISFDECISTNFYYVSTADFAQAIYTSLQTTRSLAVSSLPLQLLFCPGYLFRWILDCLSCADFDFAQVTYTSLKTTSSFALSSLPLQFVILSNLSLAMTNFCHISIADFATGKYSEIKDNGDSVRSRGDGTP